MNTTSLFSSLGAALQSLPSRRFHHERSLSMPSRAHPIVTHFQNQLSAQLDKLEESQTQSSHLTAEWLGQALQLLLNTYSNVEELIFPHIQQCDHKWANQHLEDIVKLLDVCNVVRDSISEMRQQQMLMQLAIRCLDATHGEIRHSHLVKARNSLANCIAAMRKNKKMETKLEKCISILRHMGDNLPADASPATQQQGQFVEAINDVKATTIFVCTALLSALSFKPRRISLSSIKRNVRPPSLINMQRKMKERSKATARTPLHDLDKVDSALGNLNRLLDGYLNSKLPIPLQQLKHSTQAVMASTVELDDHMTAFEDQIQQLFRYLISSRVALLNILGH